MREIRTSGSEGGGTEANRSSLPLSWIGRFETVSYARAYSLSAFQASLPKYVTVIAEQQHLVSTDRNADIRLVILSCQATKVRAERTQWFLATTPAACCREVPRQIVHGRLDFFSCVRRIAFRYVPNAATRLSRSKTMVEGVQRITSASAAYA
jgi:hypothetical protein